MRQSPITSFLLPDEHRPCPSTKRGIRCSRHFRHRGLHRGRAPIGGNHMQWRDEDHPHHRRKRRKPGPSGRARRAAKRRRAEKVARRAARAR